MKCMRRRGVAMLSAITFMLIIIALSMLMITIIQIMTIGNMYEKRKLDSYLEFERVYVDFLDNESIDGSYDGLVCEVYTSDLNSDIKALAITKNGKLTFYAVYDFSEPKLLAKQNDNFYMTQNVYGIDSKTYYYLADLVRYKEVVL